MRYDGFGLVRCPAFSFDSIMTPCSPYSSHSRSEACGDEAAAPVLRNRLLRTLMRDRRTLMGKHGENGLLAALRSGLDDEQLDDEDGEDANTAALLSDTDSDGGWSSSSRGFALGAATRADKDASSELPEEVSHAPPGGVSESASGGRSIEESRDRVAGVSDRGSHGYIVRGQPHRLPSPWQPAATALPLLSPIFTTAVQASNSAEDVPTTSPAYAAPSSVGAGFRAAHATLAQMPVGASAVAPLSALAASDDEAASPSPLQACELPKAAPTVPTPADAAFPPSPSSSGNSVPAHPAAAAALALAARMRARLAACLGEQLEEARQRRVSAASNADQARTIAATASAASQAAATTVNEAVKRVKAGREAEALAARLAKKATAAASAATRFADASAEEATVAWREASALTAAAEAATEGAAAAGRAVKDATVRVRALEAELAELSTA